MKHTHPHRALRDACLEYLDLARIPAWAANVVKVQIRPGVWTTAGIPGQPDIMAILPGGRLAGIECKTGKARLTKAQLAWHVNARRAGALVLVVRDVRQLQAELEGLTGG